MHDSLLVSGGTSLSVRGQQTLVNSNVAYLNGRAKSLVVELDLTWGGALPVFLEVALPSSCPGEVLL